MTPPTKKLRKVLQALMEKHGQVWLFAAARRSKSINNWDLLISAPWAKRPDSAIVGEVDRLLKVLLAPLENQRIGRVIIIDRSHPFFDEFFRRIGGVYDQAVVHVSGPLFGDESIIEAFVLRADNPQRAPARDTA